MYIGNGGVATCILVLEVQQRVSWVWSCSNVYIGNGGVATCILGMEV